MPSAGTDPETLPIRTTVVSVAVQLLIVRLRLTVFWMPATWWRCVRYAFNSRLTFATKPEAAHRSLVLE